MKKFIKEYLKIISMSLIGLVFVLASFYLLINYNHSEEIKKQIYINFNDSKYQEGQEIISKINNNINLARSKTKGNRTLSSTVSGLENCLNIMQSEGTFFNLKTEKYYGPVEIYNLGSNFHDKMINSCFLLNFGYMKTNDVPKEFKNIAPFISNYVDSISENVKDSLLEIENNSSYFYTTKISSITVRNYLSSDYSTIANAYIDFANIILNLSETVIRIEEEV